MTKGRIMSTIVKLTLAPATPRRQPSFYTSFHQATLAETTSGALCNSLVPDPFPPVLALPTSLALLPTIGVHPSPLHAHSLGACKTRLDR